MPRALCGAALALVVALTACAVDTPPSGRTAAIVNGELSPPGALAAAGTLATPVGDSYEMGCSAVLISETLVLTAAHCVGSAHSELGFFVGNSFDAAHVVAAGKPRAHPQFAGGVPPDQVDQWYDIGIVELDRPLTTVRPARIVRPAEIATLIKLGRGVLIAGFGQSDLADSGSRGLKHQGATTIGEISAGEIFTWGGDDPQKCAGDSGGPTFGDLDPTVGFDLRLLGVASRSGEGCQVGAIDTRVDAYLDWITTHGALPCGSGPAADCPAPTLETGDACTVAEQCRGGLCVRADGSAAGYCSQACGEDASCPDGLHCDTRLGSCLGSMPADAGVDACDGGAACASPSDSSPGADAAPPPGDDGGCALGARPPSPAPIALILLGGLIAWPRRGRRRRFSARGHDARL